MEDRVLPLFRPTHLFAAFVPAFPSSPAKVYEQPLSVPNIGIGTRGGSFGRCFGGGFDFPPFTLLAASAGISRSFSTSRANEVLLRCPDFLALFFVGFVGIWLLLFLIDIHDFF
jgi:hypothetical protein